MFTLDLFRFALEERFPGVRVGFPLSCQDGAAASALVLIELEPGGEVPVHRDSAEELLLPLEGEVEASVGDESGRLVAGELALVPLMVPHGLRNTSDRRARVLGYFAGSSVVSTFADFVAVIGAPFPIFVPVQEEAPVLA